MSRRRKGERVLGPYRVRNQWQVVLAAPDGTRRSRCFATEREARRYRAELEEAVTDTELTLEACLEEYEKHLVAKGNKPRSYRETARRLRLFFPELGMTLDALTPARCRGYYGTLAQKYAPDTHRNILAETRSFFTWCQKRHWVRSNPLDGVEGVGRRRKGKKQLRIDEARKWMAKATELANGGQAGAVAAMVTLLMGLRASEVISRVARDVDDDGRLLWIPDSKTEAGRRTLQVPEALQPYLLDLARQVKPEERIFGHHWRDWVRKWVGRICREAGVVEVCAHGMRGLHTTLAVEAGITGHVVAAALGHESVTTTYGNYATPSAVSNASQRNVLKVLSGGRR